MWSLLEEYGISKKILNDLFDGVESDLKNKVQKLLQSGSCTSQEIGYFSFTVKASEEIRDRIARLRNRKYPEQSKRDELVKKAEESVKKKAGVKNQSKQETTEQQKRREENRERRQDLYSSGKSRRDYTEQDSQT